LPVRVVAPASSSPKCQDPLALKYGSRLRIHLWVFRCDITPSYIECLISRKRDPLISMCETWKPTLHKCMHAHHDFALCIPQLAAWCKRMEGADKSSACIISDKLTSELMQAHYLEFSRASPDSRASPEARNQYAHEDHLSVQIFTSVRFSPGPENSDFLSTGIRNIRLIRIQTQYIIPMSCSKYFTRNLSCDFLRMAVQPIWCAAATGERSTPPCAHFVLPQ